LKSGARVWRKTESRDFAGVLAGEQVYFRGEPDVFGNIVADQVYINITNFYGQIIEVRGNEYQVLVNGRGGQVRRVIVDSETMRGGPSPFSISDIQVGRMVQTVGFLLQDGRVAATRVTVYANGIPVDVPKGALFLHPTTGQLQKLP
jgi:hypothetical protein